MTSNVLLVTLPPYVGGPSPEARAYLEEKQREASRWLLDTGKALPELPRLSKRAQRRTKRGLARDLAVLSC